MSNISAEDSSQSTALILENNLEASPLPSITLFPNPATQLLHIALADFQEATVTINLRNMLGQIVYEQQTARLKDVLQIDISNLPVGTYLVTAIDAKGKITTEKVVKMTP